MRSCRILLLCMLGSTACLESPDVVARARTGGAAANDAGPAEILPLTGALEVHNPTIMRGGQEFLLFSTGAGIPLKASNDLLAWRELGVVFARNPDWIAGELPGVTDLWSPDVAFFNDSFHLYYAASTFGSSRSCIGHATTDSLDADSTWTDRGPVICSNTGGSDDDWNAIDPSVLVSAGTGAWLAFGSYRSGIKLIRLDETGARTGPELHALATRPDAGPIQAAALAAHGGYFYLFVSFDACCQGAASNYKLMVGRAESVEGPYLDRAGRPLLEGGGTLVLEGDERWRGPGSNDVLIDGDRQYNVYHAYDAQNGGRSTLRLSTLAWDDAGWPVSGGP
jgi:arabinan endo-1,5-alpha-L-arabinosidase